MVQVCAFWGMLGVMRRLPVFVFLLLASVLAGAVPVAASDATTPEVIVVEATGSYLMGDRDTRTQARRLALEQAKRNALEQAGTRLESLSRVENFELKRDEIITKAAGTIKAEILSEDWAFVADTLKVTMDIRAAITPEDVTLDEDERLSPEPAPEEPAAETGGAGESGPGDTARREGGRQDDGVGLEELRFVKDLVLDILVVTGTAPGGGSSKRRPPGRRRLDAAPGPERQAPGPGSGVASAGAAGNDFAAAKAAHRILDNPESGLALGYRLVRTGHASQALDLADALSGRYPNLADVQHLRSKALAALDRPVEATRALAKGCELGSLRACRDLTRDN